MSEYMDVICFKKTKSDKTFAVRLGTARKRDDGGMSLYLDAIPAPVNGQYEMAVVARQVKTTGGAATKNPDDLNSDSIPF